MSRTLEVKSVFRAAHREESHVTLRTGRLGSEQLQQLNSSLRGITFSDNSLTRGGICDWSRADEISSQRLNDAVSLCGRDLDLVTVSVCVLGRLFLEPYPL